MAVNDNYEVETLSETTRVVSCTALSSKSRRHTDKIVNGTRT